MPHHTDHFALAEGFGIGCCFFLSCRDSVCKCEKDSVCKCERDRDGWILWADVYEVWSKWSEKRSSWQRTSSRLEKGD